MNKITLTKSIILFILIIMIAPLNAQKANWSEVKSTLDILSKERKNIPLSAKVFEYNYDNLFSTLITAPQREYASSSAPLVVAFPNTKGEMSRFEIVEASVMAPELQSQYPEIRSFAGFGLDDPTAYLRFSISPYKGISGIILSGNETATILESVTDHPNQLTLYKRNSKRHIDGSFECSTIESIENNQGLKTSNSVKSADDSKLRTYDAAISVTGEYTAYHGGTLAGANAAIAATLTRVNGIYETDFGITIILIPNNNSIVYTTAATDPYSPASSGQDPHPIYGGSPYFAANWQVELQDNVLTPIIGEANYDFGHLFGDSGGGGNAGCIGCICVSQAHIGGKGSAYTSPGDGVPEGDTFDVDYVAHEMGHQFGARHTFTHSSEGSGVAQMEPGSGSTIMGYAGITGSTDVQSNSDPYFHAISIQQITAHSATRPCDVETPTGNATPIVNAGTNLTLPIGTAFRLTGSATDADTPSNELTYCWEQFNENNAATTYPDETSNDNNSVLFRSYSPTTDPIRTFPKLENLLDNGVNGFTWERVPTVGRTASFRLTVRDNEAGGGQNDYDDMTVTWDASKGPLAVTSQAATGIKWLRNTTETITWDVNSTNTMSGASNVDILLSVDGGLTYPITLAANTPNDGTEDIIVPDNPAPYCRVMVQPTGAPFFAINSEDFAINYDVVTTCNVYSSGPISTAITDNGQAYTEVLAINNVPSSTISDINIGIDITHTYIGDLVILVQSPEGTGTLLMIPDDCGSQDDLDVKFDDDGAPFDCDNTTGVDLVYQSLQEPLSDWSGEDAGGQWLLGLGDYYSGDAGTINEWYVEVCETSLVLSNPDEELVNNFSIYPNPNKGSFTVELNSNSNEDVNIDIFDIRGRQVYSNLFGGSARFSQAIDLDVHSGVYLVKVSNGKFSETKKIIIE